MPSAWTGPDGLAWRCGSVLPANRLWDAITSAVLQHYDPAGGTPSEGWMHGLRRVLTSPALQGEYLKVNAAMQRTLAEAISDRTGTDAGRDMQPAILAGAVIAATQVALQRWLDADPPGQLRPLLQGALEQLAGAFTAA